MGEFHDKDERRVVKSTLPAKIESILGSSTIKFLRHMMNAIIILVCFRLVEYFANVLYPKDLIILSWGGVHLGKIFLIEKIEDIVEITIFVLLAWDLVSTFFKEIKNGGKNVCSGWFVAL